MLRVFKMETKVFQLLSAVKFIFKDIKQWDFLSQTINTTVAKLQRIFCSLAALHSSGTETQTRAPLTEMLGGSVSIILHLSSLISTLAATNAFPQAKTRARHFPLHASLPRRRLQLSQDSPPVRLSRKCQSCSRVSQLCGSQAQVLRSESGTWPHGANRKGQILPSLTLRHSTTRRNLHVNNVQKKCVSRPLSLKTQNTRVWIPSTSVFTEGLLEVCCGMSFFHPRSWSTGHCHCVAVSPFSWQTDFLLERHYYLTGSTHPATDLFYFCSWQSTATLGNVSFLIWLSPSGHFSKLTPCSSLSKHRISWKAL